MCNYTTARTRSANMKSYRTSAGEVLTYNELKKWADSFYRALDDKEYILPSDWFKRVSKVLKLEEVI